MSPFDSLFQPLFQPRRIALIGASSDDKRTTSRPQRFLQKHGFVGEILPVNPGRAEIFGIKAWKTIDAVPGDIDHAYILLNGKDAVAALAACAKRGVKVASILAGGFADAGAAGASLQDELVRIVEDTGIRLVGPNSIGTVSTDPPMALTANAAFAVDKLRAGNWGLVSQSGSLIGALLSRADARGIGFSRLISVGNEVDLKLGEIADLLVDDPKTKAILLFMETLRDGERLARAARRAHQAGKPVVAYKLGRSEIGQPAPWHRPRRDVRIADRRAGAAGRAAAPCQRRGARQARRSRHDDRRWCRDGGRQHGGSGPRHRGSAPGAGRLAEAVRHRGRRRQAGRSHLGRRQARDRRRHDRAAAGRRRQRCGDLRRRLFGAVQPGARGRAVAALRRLEEAVRGRADAGRGEIAGAADRGGCAGVSPPRIMRRGDGALPAAADAAAGAQTGRAVGRGARRARGGPNGLRRAAGE
ncbi:MAG: hypothetical protein E6G95_21220 [Alphaproteobacteria bacterium]|nr:MAG: hypothetical protein E6G95_21220 [Alphaproteobacteria bacterium]